MVVLASSITFPHAVATLPVRIIRYANPEAVSISTSMCSTTTGGHFFFQVKVHHLFENHVLFFYGCCQENCILEHTHQHIFGMSHTKLLQLHDPCALMCVCFIRKKYLQEPFLLEAVNYYYYLHSYVTASCC